MSFSQKDVNALFAKKRPAGAAAAAAAEVEGVEDRGAKLADFTLGYVQSAEKHPDADRLQICQVDTDEGVQQIICGAPNARQGITVVVAKPGVYVPGIDTTIGVGKIRGVESFGMMASEQQKNTCRATQT